ncbi:MAG TPA: dihydrolipoyl dehydrogenase [Clostridiales bacterium]|jgi:dihydrolipoamide dehydrogenase|nr:dihydrolipoyl dehydrogenase [Clostridiales bacterium]
MAETIIMPKLGFNMSEGKLLKWYKNEGDNIKKGEPLFSIETDKTSIDIEATDDSVLRKILVEEGETVPVTLPIAIVGDLGENIDELLKEALVQLGKESAIVPTAPKADEPLSHTAVVEQPAKASGRDFDIIVIGGGPGGYVAAIKGAQLRKKVAIVEKDSFGGVCINKGCIPTKVLLRSAESLDEVKKSSNFGVINVDTSNAKLDLKLVQKRKTSVISQLVGGINGLMAKNNVTVIKGEGSIKDKNTVIVDGKPYSTDYIVIATGSEVKSLPIPIDSGMNILTSDDALNLEEIPKDIAIIGGGVIGIEFAYFFASIGSKVTVIEFLDRILPMVDEEITDQVTAMLKDMKVDIYTSAKVTEVTKDGVKFEKDNRQQSISVSNVLMAVGRVPDYKGIDCESLNIKTDRGAIVTDLTLKTSVDNIYAIGDVNGKYMLAHTASAEGIIAIENICGLIRTMDYDKIPSAVYIQPEIACVGLTEAQAREKYGNIKVGRFPILANGKAKVAGNENGLIKVILEPRYNEILGVHLFCIHATDMIAEAVAAMNLEASAEEITWSVHPHPTVSEVFHEAFHAALDKAIHF